MKKHTVPTTNWFNLPRRNNRWVTHAPCPDVHMSASANSEKNQKNSPNGKTEKFSTQQNSLSNTTYEGISLSMRYGKTIQFFRAVNWWENDTVIILYALPNRKPLRKTKKIVQNFHPRFYISFGSHNTGYSKFFLKTDGVVYKIIFSDHSEAYEGDTFQLLPKRVCQKSWYFQAY